MSKRTRHADNSKRQQPVQQQRAQAALQIASQKKGLKPSESPPPQERSEQRSGR
jgi:hypothetical protein